MLNNTRISIATRIVVQHDKGWFEITKEELLEILNNKGLINEDKLQSLYSRKYHPRLYAA